jgi:hypothetical protein
MKPSERVQEIVQELLETKWQECRNKPIGDDAALYGTEDERFRRFCGIEGGDPLLWVKAMLVYLDEQATRKKQAQA